MLKGIRIVDFTRYLPGPYATLRLADMGADIIKVESPGSGDPARTVGTNQYQTGFVYFANNSNKKSVTINLKEVEGQRLAFQLAATADVVIESFRPGVANALGIGYEKLKQERPDIIYCSLSGYGQEGPLREFGGHDINYMALSGVLSQLKDQTGTPIQPGLQFADLIGGIAAVEAILAALVKKANTSMGSYLDLSITDILIGMMNTHSLIQHTTGKGNGVFELGGNIVSYRIYETKDRRFMSLGALEAKFWDNFCQAVGRLDWKPKHFSSANDENPTYFEIKELFKSRTFQEWIAFSEEIDCCLTPILNIDEMLQSPHVQKKRLATDITSHEWKETLKQTKTSAGGARALEPESDLRNSPPPILGQNTREVLLEILRVQHDQMDDWEKRGII